MKKYLFSIIFLLVSYVGFSQKGLSYQAVVLDPTAIEVPGQDITGQPLVNGDVWMKFSIYNGSTLQFEEVQKTKTDAYGLVNLMIGSVSSASFNSLTWDGVQKSLQVFVSFNQGASYTKVSDQKLNYNPYALFAETAGKLGSVLSIAGGGTGATTAADARVNLGLGNVDNTSDAAKPVSTATQNALNLKANAAEVTAALAAKADTGVIKSYVDTKLATGNFASNQSSTATITDADANTKGKIKLAGDLAGTAAAPTVPGLALKANTVDVLAALDLKANSSDVTTALALKANGANVATSLNLKENTTNKSTNVTTDGASDTKYPSVKAVKTYVDAQISTGVNSATITDADASTKGKIQLAGDLAGTAAAPTVPGLALKANTADVNSALALKANTTDATVALAAKADTAYVLTKVAAATIADADANTKGKIQLAGDLAGTAAAPTIPALALKANAADLVTLTSVVTSNTASITANSTAITTEATTARAAELVLTNKVAANTASITANTNAILLKAPIASPVFTGTVAIGTTNPSAAAVLDITSTSKGLLLPRLTFAQKSAITSPEAGLILWCSDCGTNGELQVYNGTNFVNMVGANAQFALPTISATSAASAITSSALTSGGSIDSDGGAFVTARGVVWNTSTNPTVSLSTKTTDGTGIGTFSSSISGLTSGVTYYVRAYATNSVGTKYGPEITVNTAQAVATLASTTAASSIGATSATSGGNITYNGGATVTVSGLVWSTSSNPTIALSTKTSNGSASGTFTSNITSLTPGTLYYVRSYATNNVGTSYGAQTSFTTLNTPTISSTTAASSLTSSSAVSGGTISADGGDAVTTRGIVYGTSAGSSTYSVTSGSGTGTFTGNITGLTPATTYYVRAFATNNVGTVYGPEISFTTIAIAPSVAATAIVASITGSTAISGGNISSDGGASVTSRGLVWGTSAGSSTFSVTTGAGIGTYTSSLSGLLPATLYYVRAFATNSIGTSYGPERNFTTLAIAPTISATASATSITSSTATIGGTITSDGGAAVTARGVVYGTSSLSSTFSVTSGTGTGTYSIGLTGLTPATTYYVRSFATNSVGTVYGTETSFSTIAVAPSLTTTEASSISKYAASAGGTITSNGGSVITASGICWSTTAIPTISDSKTTDGTTSGTFTSSIIGLTAGTTYYVRAYAINAIGTGYATAQSFTTLSTASNNPVLASTTPASSITSSSAILGGNITDEGATQVSVRGLVYGTTTGSSTFSVTIGSGAGTFTSTLTGLTQGTTYFVRSFATNVQGTSYGTETSFTTQTTPTVSVTNTPSSITTTSAISGGIISSTGGATVTVSGVVWSLTSTPTITLASKTTDGTTSGTFTSSITGLTQGATYHVRAYATNYLGTSYGPDITFTTITTPTVSSTATVTSITGTTATSGGTITVDGGATVTSRGLVWGTTTGSSTYSVTSGSGTGTYTASLTGLSIATTYFVRAFATNSAGTVYGPEVQFSTPSTATVASTITSTITSSTAILGGVLTSNGGATTTIGIMYSTASNFGTFSTTTINANAVAGTYTTTISGLSELTTYYAKVFATNAAGTIYGPSLSFSTPAVPVTLGGQFQGGTVVYIYKSGDPGYISGETHGIIMSNNFLNNSQSTVWSSETTTTSTNATGTALGAGLTNSNTIYSAIASNASAVNLCRNYSVTINGITYSNWYLPSIGEWNAIFNNSSTGKLVSFSRDSDANVSGVIYAWTSSEISASDVTITNIVNGGSFPIIKKWTGGGYVRAIRYF